MRDGGAIVNFSSPSAKFVATTEAAAYAITKAAVSQVTRSFAMAYAPRGIRVNALSPGITDTPMQERVLRRGVGGAGHQPRGAAAARLKTVPMGRSAPARGDGRGRRLAALGRGRLHHRAGPQRGRRHGDVVIALDPRGARGPARATAGRGDRRGAGEGAHRLDPAGRARVPRGPPAQRDGRVRGPRRPVACRAAGRWCRAAVVVRDDGHARPSVVVPLRPVARRRGPAPDVAPARRVRGSAGGGPHRPRAAGPQPPGQAGVRGGRGERARPAGDGAVLPGAQRRPRDRSRDGLAGRDRPRVDDGDVVGRGHRARPRPGRSPAAGPGRVDRRRLRPQPAVHAGRANGTAQLEAAARSSPNAPKRRSTGSQSTRSRTSACSWNATGRSGWC